VGGLIAIRKEGKGGVKTQSRERLLEGVQGSRTEKGRCAIGEKGGEGAAGIRPGEGGKEGGWEEARWPGRARDRRAPVSVPGERAPTPGREGAERTGSPHGGSGSSCRPGCAPEEVGGEGRGTHARDDEASSCCLRLRSRMRIPKRPLPHARGRHCTACVDTKAAQPHDDLDPSRFCSCKEVAARLGHFICREALGQTEEDTGSAFKRWTQSLRAGDISLHDSESRVSQKLVFRDFACVATTATKVSQRAPNL